MASDISHLANEAIEYVSNIKATLYLGSNEYHSLRDEAASHGIKITMNHHFNSSQSSRFTYIVIVKNSVGNFFALLGIYTNDDTGDQYLEFETFTSWEERDITTKFVRTRVIIDIEPALLVSAITALPRGIGTIHTDSDLFCTLSNDEWESLGVDLDEDNETITL